MHLSANLLLTRLMGIAIPQGLRSSMAITFNTPLLLGGRTSVRVFRIALECWLMIVIKVTWCWFVGSWICLALGASIAEIVSAFPTCRGLYAAPAHLCLRRHRAIVGWIVSWLNILGQGCTLDSSKGDASPSGLRH